LRKSKKNLCGLYDEECSEIMLHERIKKIGLLMDWRGRGLATIIYSFFKETWIIDGFNLKKI
jgi:hypothetical protein